MHLNTLAPWAEVVPGARPMTTKDLLAFPEDDAWRYELVMADTLGVSPLAERFQRLPPPGVNSWCNPA